MVCLDTDFLVALIRKDAKALKKFEEIIPRPTYIAPKVTPISATELFEGAFKTGKQEEIQKVEDLLSILDMLYFDFEASREAGKLLHKLKKGGEQIGDMDTMIGAIAIRHGEAILITKNARHFSKIKEIQVEGW